MGNGQWSELICIFIKMIFEIVHNSVINNFKFILSNYKNFNTGIDTGIPILMFYNAVIPMLTFFQYYGIPIGDLWGKTGEMRLIKNLFCSASRNIT